MSRLYLYALVSRPRRALALRALGGGKVRLVRARGFWVAASDVDEAPAPDLRALRAHERCVRRLFETSGAALPFRFGTTVKSRAELERLLKRRARALTAALAQVEGRAQVALRLTRAAQPQAKPKAKTGAAYLKARVLALQLPELSATLEAARPYIRAEKVERPAQGPFQASVFHLVDRKDARAYLRCVKRAPVPEGVRLFVSAPGPAWAFVPEVA